jgi:hypothetical protein
MNTMIFAALTAALAFVAHGEEEPVLGRVGDLAKEKSESIE